MVDFAVECVVVVGCVVWVVGAFVVVVGSVFTVVVLGAPVDLI